ncbi:uncharacterized protein LOC126837247 [Adelges cooleyi]|uniref:uncharacterized protein LOC126837247 n=1 Tax=Adelges cooleyi TaxID=133065 RepID=UPI00217F2BFE|nr:uncharacterized protein LOC126837247 [Adelges cooleyi]
MTNCYFRAFFSRLDRSLADDLSSIVMTFRTCCVSSRAQVTIGLMLGVYITMATRSHFNLMLVDASESFQVPNVHFMLNIVYQVGFMAVQVPSGIWLDGVNPVPVLGVIVLALAVSSFISPFTFRAGLLYPSAMLAGINGMIVGCWWPSMGVMLSNWAPPAELSCMYSTINTGIPGGTILGTVIPGIIYTNRNSSDFHHSFFVLAAACALWGFFWLYAFYGSPLKDPGVGEEELQYLSTHIKPKSELAVPWKYIATSVPVWSMLLANYGSTVFYAALLYYMPVYVKTVLKLDLSQNGFISATPPLSQMVVIFITGYVAMVVQKKEWTTVTNIRKVGSPH